MKNQLQMLRSANKEDFNVEREILELAPQWLENPSVVFEHGQWFLIGFDDEDDARTFAVVDCADANGNDYLDLEEL